MATYEEFLACWVRKVTRSMWEQVKFHKTVEAQIRDIARQVHEDSFFTVLRMEAPTWDLKTSDVCPDKNGKDMTESTNEDNAHVV